MHGSFPHGVEDVNGLGRGCLCQHVYIASVRLPACCFVVACLLPSCQFTSLLDGLLACLLSLPTRHEREKIWNTNWQEYERTQNTEEPRITMAKLRRLPAARVREMRTPCSVRNPTPGAADAVIRAPLLGTMHYKNTGDQIDMLVA